MGQTVLIIEDDPWSARLAELILEAEGYQVVIAPNGLQGLKIATHTPPNLILLDLMLPGLDGFEVLNRLRATPQTAAVPIVIVSAKSGLDDKETASKIGADAYFLKPYNKADLLKVVHSLLDEELMATSRGHGVLLLGPHGNEATQVALYTGLALVDRGETATVVDLRPFSVEHSLLLDVSPRSAPVSLSDAETVGKLSEFVSRHPGGLYLLNNLEGNGEAGQLTPEDARTVLNLLLTGGGFVLLDTPLYPADILRHTADRCDLVLLVVRGNPASLAAARSALTLMERAGVKIERISMVLVGLSETDLGQAVLGTVPAGAASDDPAFQTLADRLESLKLPAPKGGERDVI
jgi:DNA-binding response OmpR family regulator